MASSAMGAAGGAAGDFAACARAEVMAWRWWRAVDHSGSLSCQKQPYGGLRQPFAVRRPGRTERLQWVLYKRTVSAMDAFSSSAAAPLSAFRFPAPSAV